MAESLALVLGWKHSHEPGIRTATIAGGEEITAWPEALGGPTLPDAADVATWRTEYDAYIASGGREDDAADAELDGMRLLKAVALWAADHFGITPATARAEIRAKYRSLG